MTIDCQCLEVLYFRSVHCIAQAFSFPIIITRTFGNQTAHLNAYSIYFKGSVFLFNKYFLFIYQIKTSSDA